FYLPAVTALLLPLTGLAAGACQEIFHSWGEGYVISFGECLKVACQRGLQHVASQGLSLIGPVGILAFMVSPVASGGARIAAILFFGLWTLIVSLFSLTRQPSFAA